MRITGRIFIPGVIAIIVSLPIVAIFMPQQMTLYGIILTIMSGLTAHERKPVWHFDIGLRLDPFLIAMLAFLGYAALTALWSLDEEQTFRRWFRICGLAILGYFAIHCSARVAEQNAKLAWVMAASVLILFAVFVFELFTGFLAASVWQDEIAIARANLLNRPSMILGLVIWPALLVLWCRGFRWIPVLIGLSLPVAFFFTSSLGAFLAATLACVVWAVASIFARLCAWLIGIAFAISMIAIPILALNVPLINSGLALFARYEFFSGAHRLGIWNFVATMIRERPLLGWGLDSARNIPQADLPLASVLSKAVVLDYPTIPTLPLSPAMPLHPHNAALQIILETGVVGAALFCLAVLCLALQLSARQNQFSAPFALASLTSWLVFVGANIGLWQSWWLTSSIVTIIFYTFPLRSNGKV
ncbi:MAG: O-antigen ligase family protein [Alphaproteobacteria bacterium]